MLCPHCSSPRHTLCAAGFNINVELSTFDPSSDPATALCQLAATEQRHLLGNPTLSAEQTSNNVLIVLPVFTDSGLGAFGRTIIETFAPHLLDETSGARVKSDGAMFDARSGNTLFVPLPVHGRRVSALLIGMGTGSASDRQNICGYIGVAIDSAVSGQYAQLVIALSDLSSSPMLGQQIAATTRCRLSVGVVEDQIDKVLAQMTLVASREQIEAICHGIQIAGPLCSNCTHPRAATVRLPTLQ